MANILVVDDHLDNRQFLATLLGYKGHRVVEASDGAEALERVRSSQPDLAIVDLVMPNMDGYEFARQMHSDPGLAVTPIIFQSAAYNEGEAQPLATACGVSHFLAKPADVEKVLQVIGEVLGSEEPSRVPDESFDRFDRDHRRLLTNKLSQKTRDLEKTNEQLVKLNAELESRVEERTAELNRSNAELERFAFVAAHDLQEPLRKVIAYAKLLSNRFKGELGSDAGEYIGQTVDAATRMQQLIRDLLAYSRAGKGGDLLAVDCEKPLTSAIDNLRVAIEESGARITKGALPTVRGDEAQLTSLFQNLIGNAIKYRDRQNTTTPKIHVSANRCGEEWKFEVCDNGIGIDPQYSTQIFALFQRLHSRSDYPGVGIGLAICAKIVERHGGRIWVESQLGQGATFYFTLPAR